MTAAGDFVLGGSGFREVYSPEGMLIGDSSNTALIRIDGADTVYMANTTEIIRRFMSI